ncbi:hypothetical protein [Pseudomonas mediterranea]|uniref:hypothetical protein n=1 Tax=Pseudomonas mediterranea TaxID=183795 RepID=UPI00068D7CE9|nr:hypothetical protein [Pseudomonas mediterranea]
MSGDDEAQRRFDERQRDTKLATAEGEVPRLIAEREALQQRLTAADQRIDELEQALKFYAEREHYHFESGNWDTVSGEPLNILWCGDEPDFIEDGSVARAALFASAEPAMESKPPAYKPGLYAVRHIDNWDGERDVVLTFALLDADGKWTDKETGKPLMTYKGDKVLRAWPLDCSDAPDTQIIGVPHNWLEDWALELVEAAQDGGQMSNQVEHLLEIHAKP